MCSMQHPQHTIPVSGMDTKVLASCGVPTGVLLSSGPTGDGVMQLYTPEINADVPGAGSTVMGLASRPN
jgi:hypothetical protein